MAAESSEMATGPTNREMIGSPPETMQYQDLLRSMKLTDSKEDLALLDRIGQWIHDRPRIDAAPRGTPGREDTNSAVTSIVNRSEEPGQGATSVSTSGSLVNNDKLKLMTSIIEEVSASLLLQRLIRSFEQRSMQPGTVAGKAQMIPLGGSDYRSTNEIKGSTSSPLSTTKQTERTAPTNEKQVHPSDQVSDHDAGDVFKTSETGAGSPPCHMPDNTGCSSSSDADDLGFDAYFISDLGESRGAFSKVRHLNLSPRVLNCLLGVANDLVSTIPKLQEIILRGGEFQDLTPTPTVSVAQVATRCLESLLMQERIRKARKLPMAHGVAVNDPTRSISTSPSLYQVIVEFLKNPSTPLSPQDNDPMQNGETTFTTPIHQQQQDKTNLPNNTLNSQSQQHQAWEQEDFKLTTFLTRTLLTIRRQAVQCVESSYDFDYLFQSSCNLPLVRKALQLQRNLDHCNNGNAFASDAISSRVNAWKLACAISLRQEIFQHRQQEAPQPSSTHGVSTSNSSGGSAIQLASTTMSRRQKLVAMAASLVIMYSLPQMISFAAATAAVDATSSSTGASEIANSNTNGAISNETSAQFEDAEQAQFDDAEMGAVPETQPEISPCAKHPKVGPSEEVDTSTQDDVKMDVEILSVPDEGSDSEEEDLVDMIVQITNRLCTYLAWASLERDEICSLSRSEVETQLFGLVRELGNLPLVQRQPFEKPLASPYRKWPHATFWTLLQRSISRPRFLNSHFVEVIDELNRDTLGRYSLPATSSFQDHPMNSHPHFQLPVAVVPFLRSEDFLVHRRVEDAITEDGTSAQMQCNSLASICPKVYHRPYSRDYIVAVVPKDCDSIHDLVQRISDRISTGIASSDEITALATTPGNGGTPTGNVTPMIEKGSTESTYPPGTLASTPFLTDIMELNEWTISVVSLSVVKPSNRLTKLLGSSGAGTQNSAGQTTYNASSKPLRTIIAPLLNRALARIHQDITLAPGRQQQEDSGVRESYHRQKPPAACPVSVSPDDGHVYIECDEIACTPDIQLCASVIGLYYHALEAILQDEVGRFQDANGQRSQSSSSVDRNERLIRSPPFHRALLVCCYTCVLKAVGASSNHDSLGKRKRMVTVKISPKHHDLTIYSLLKTMESTPYTYLKVTEAFVRALTPAERKSPHLRPSASTERGSSVLGSPILFGLPRVLQHHIKRTEVQVIDSVVWSPDLHLHFRAPDMNSEENTLEEESLCHAISILRSSIPPHSEWPPESLAPDEPEELENMGMRSQDTTQASARRLSMNPEAKFVSYIFRKILRISHARIQAICHGLGIPSSFPVASEAWIAYRYLVRQHIEVLYGRHVDHLILCSIYGTCKMMKMKPDVSFTRIIDVYVSVRARELGERSCQRIVRHIKLLSSEEEEQASSKRLSSQNVKKPKLLGDIIDFYNKVFIPKMKRHFLRAKSIKRNTAILQTRIADQNQERIDSQCKDGSDRKDAADSHSSVARSDGSESYATAHQHGNNRIVSPAGPSSSKVAVDLKEADGGGMKEGSSPGKENGDKEGSKVRSLLEFGEASTVSMQNVTAAG